MVIVRVHIMPYLDLMTPFDQCVLVSRGQFAVQIV